MLFILGIIILLSIFGYIIGHSKIGNKDHLSHMVEAIDEDNPNKISIDQRKKKWALFFYSFSFSRNFREIFVRSYKTIRDRKFDVFDGLRVFMQSWIILGFCYLMGNVYGNITQITKK